MSDWLAIDKYVNILGTEYSIVFRNKEDDEVLKDSSGYCDFTVKLIVVANKPKDNDYLDYGRYQMKVLRHEIIHAFLLESGLDNNSNVFEEAWARNEEMIDFFAIQSPKLMNAFIEAGCLEVKNG